MAGTCSVGRDLDVIGFLFWDGADGGNPVVQVGGGDEGYRGRQMVVVVSEVDGVQSQR